VEKSGYLKEREIACQRNQIKIGCLHNAHFLKALKKKSITAPLIFNRLSHVFFKACDIEFKDYDIMLYIDCDERG
jgi:hypothetical protein